MGRGGGSLASHQYFPHGTDPWDVFPCHKTGQGSGLFIPYLFKGALICSENVMSNYNKISESCSKRTETSELFQASDVI